MSLLKQPLTVRIDDDFDLPSLPLVLSRIISALDNEDFSIQELEGIIDHDPSLAGRILRLANSAFYAFRREVKTLSHAISLLGVNHVKSLAIGVHIFEALRRQVRHPERRLRELWMHSFAVGLISQKIWSERAGRREAEFAFLCGLLHDVGKIVFFVKDSTNYGGLFSKLKTSSDPSLEFMERDYYGVDHAEIGARIAEKWALPKELSAVICGHHDALRSGEPLVGAVALADCLARQAGIGYDGDGRLANDFEDLLSWLHVTPEELESLHEYIQAKQGEVEDFFKMAF